MGYAKIRDMLGTVRAVCQTQALIADTLERGLDIAERFGFSLYDSMIVSSVLQSGCNILYSEDMQHSQKIEGQLVVMNLFLDN
jgi:predicted nucleic acid-binding protein